MKQLLLGLFALLGFAARAQFQTPGAGVRWTLAQLAAAPGSNVAAGPGATYSVSGNLRLSPTDTLVINQNVTVRLDPLVRVNVDGVLLVNPRDSVKFTTRAANPGPWEQFWFSATSAGSRVRKAVFEAGGGLKVVGAAVEFDSCVVRGQLARVGSVNTNSGALNVSGAAPRILNCRFVLNARSAILSPANIGTSPVIRHCVFVNNDTENGNYPQINLGVGASTPIVVENCRVLGGPYNLAGGIAVANLLGSAGTTQVEIRGNYVAHNRYGLALLGSGLTVRVLRNAFVNNNINPNAQTGGSGLNLQGTATLTGTFARSVVTGNLWGVTVLRASAASPGPTVSFGDAASADTLNVGRNRFSGNGNGGQVYDFYNNTADDQLAQNNDWGTNSAADIEAHVFHRPDNPALGLVNFQPFRQTLASMAPTALDASVFPNPARAVLTAAVPGAALVAVRLRDLQGRVVLDTELRPAAGQLRVPLGTLPAGVYCYELVQGAQRLTGRVAVE